MKPCKVFSTVAFLFLAVTLFGKEDTAYVNNLLQESKKLFSSDPQQAIALSQKARELAKKISFPEGEATALKNIGIVYYNQQKYLETLDFWTQSLQIFEAQKDDNGIANLLNNIAAVYKDRGDDDKALDYSLRSLKIAESTGNQMRIMSSLVTIASIYHNKKDPKALGYLFKAKDLTDKESLPTLHANIAEVYLDLGVAKKKNADSLAAANAYFLKAQSFYLESIKGDDQSASAAYAYNGLGKVFYHMDKMNLALNNHRKALAISEKLDEKWNRFKALQGIANAYQKQNNNESALEFYSKAQLVAEEVDNTDIADLYRDMAVAYQGIGDYKNAFTYKSKYAEKEKEIYNSDVEKQLGRLQLNFDLYKKDGEVNLLTKEKKLEQQAKTGFAIGLVLIAIIAIILYRNYKVKVKTNKILDKQKDEIEGLLLNILPAEVAKELQVSGKATPKHFENVSVLFTDFKGFTALADKMTPSDLVNQLNDCFIAFDSIIDKYGLEKIKTIGDAYMCAGGIPTPDEKHAYKIARAAIEIQEWIKKNNEKRLLKGLEPWDIRIGIHVGSIVAGVVGKRKYAYDIWGSTVNIASRMESNGEPGRVNISAAAYESIKDEFNCSYRGKIYAKNVGEIDMYFIDSEIDSSFRLVNTRTEMASPAIASLN